MRTRLVVTAVATLALLGGFIGLRFWLEGGSTARSVTLVVDFGDNPGWDQRIAVIDDFEGTGWQLLAQSGLNVEGTAEYPNSFVCRISGWPRESQEDCLGMPTPQTGYWKYFIANSATGGRWIASGVGAAGHRPECGSAEGWLWVKESTPVNATPGVDPEVFTCK